jgi:hypothetical protein
MGNNKSKVVEETGWKMIVPNESNSNSISNSNTPIAIVSVRLLVVVVHRSIEITYFSKNKRQ